MRLRGGRVRNFDGAVKKKRRREGTRKQRPLEERRDSAEQGGDGREGTSKDGGEGRESAAPLTADPEARRGQVRGEGKEVGDERPDSEAQHGEAGGAGKEVGGESEAKAELVDWERDDPSLLPTTADLLRMYKGLPVNLQAELDSMAGRWVPANETVASTENEDDRVGIALESVWKNDQLVGVRVKNVFEGATQEETGGIMRGDWLMSVGGIDCSELNIPEVGEAVHEAIRNGAGDSVELTLRRGMGGEVPQQGGDIYRVILKKEWFGTLPGDEESESSSEREAEAWLKNWVEQ